MGDMNVTFKEPVHKIVDQIKNEPYFRWPNKMGGDSLRRNQNLYYTYHRDKGHHLAVQSVKRSSRAVSKGEIFERVCNGPKESRS